MSGLQQTLRRALADRHAPEARAMFLLVLKYVDQQARATWRSRYRDLLSPSEVEELTAEAVTRLMAGSLARFRGDTEAELYAFLRTVTVRTVREAALRRLRERQVREQVAVELRAQSRASHAAAEHEVQVVEVPLSAGDQAYLSELLRAGSKAELARQRGQSRAAVTRMIQRIQDRIEDMSPDHRMAVDAWMRQEARIALNTS